MEVLEERIKRHEGFRDRVYLDSEGNPTGGWGHHFYLGSRLSVEVAQILLKQDITIAVADFMKIAPSTRKKLDLERKRVVVEMIFNMGLQRVLQFRRFWEAIEKEDWTKAKMEMLDSKWHSQVGVRAEELAEIFERGGGDYVGITSA